MSLKISYLKTSWLCWVQCFPKESVTSPTAPRSSICCSLCQSKFPDSCTFWWLYIMIKKHLPMTVLVRLLLKGQENIINVVWLNYPACAQWKRKMHDVQLLFTIYTVNIQYKFTKSSRDLYSHLFFFTATSEVRSFNTLMWNNCDATISSQAQVTKPLNKTEPTFPESFPSIPPPFHHMAMQRPVSVDWCHTAMNTYKQTNSCLLTLL